MNLIWNHTILKRWRQYGDKTKTIGDYWRLDAPGARSPFLWRLFGHRVGFLMGFHFFGIVICVVTYSATDLKVPYLNLVDLLKVSGSLRIFQHPMRLHIKNLHFYKFLIKSFSRSQGSSPWYPNFFFNKKPYLGSKH